MLCFMLVPWKHIFWHCSVMELKTRRQNENFPCMLLSCECQILLHVSSYSSISSSVKGTECMHTALFLVSVPLVYNEVLFKSFTTSWHFKSPHSHTHCGILKKSIFILYFLHVVLANLFLGSDRVSVWHSVCYTFFRIWSISQITALRRQHPS